MRVAISGATGLIGRHLVAKLAQRGDEIAILARNTQSASTLFPDHEIFHWDALEQHAPAEAFVDRDAVIHLAGEPIAQRWNSAVKDRIKRSRVVGTQNLVAGLAAADQRPSALICASAVGYYGDRGAEELDETSSTGDDFLAQVCQEWEQAARSAEAHGVRVVRVRTGVVIDRDGGVLAQALPFFRFGLGGRVGSGHQYMSWIHLDDLIGIYIMALETEQLSGPLNATTANPITNREFTKSLGKALHRPTLIPVPKVALRALYGELAESLSGGQRVLPKRALELGYQFKFQNLSAALHAALE